MSKIQFRDVMHRLAPPFLQGENAEAYLYPIWLGLDLLLNKQGEGQGLHMPGLGDPSGLPWLGRDRLLVQGGNETNDQFAARLQEAFPTWQHAGSRPAILEQLQAYVQGDATVVGQVPAMTIVGGNSLTPGTTSWDVVYNTTPIGGAPFRQNISPRNWGWDGVNAPWRAWLVLFMTDVPTGMSGTAASIVSTGGSGVAGVTSGFATISGLAGMSASNLGQWLTITGATTIGKFQIVAVPSPSSVIIAAPTAIAPDASNGAIPWSVSYYPFIGPGPVWGSPLRKWGDATNSWGLSCPQSTIDGIRNILNTWKRASTYYPNIIVAFDGGDGTSGKAFSPNSSMGSGNPDDTWGPQVITVAGKRVPNRINQVSTFDCFCTGTGRRVQCTMENVT